MGPLEGFAELWRCNAAGVPVRDGERIVSWSALGAGSFWWVWANGVDAAAEAEWRGEEG